MSSTIDEGGEQIEGARPQRDDGAVSQQAPLIELQLEIAETIPFG